MSLIAADFRAHYAEEAPVLLDHRDLLPGRGFLVFAVAQSTPFNFRTPQHLLIPLGRSLLRGESCAEAAAGAGVGEKVAWRMRTILRLNARPLKFCEQLRFAFEPEQMDLWGGAI